MRVCASRDGGARCTHQAAAISRAAFDEARVSAVLSGSAVEEPMDLVADGGADGGGDGGEPYGWQQESIVPSLVGQQAPLSLAHIECTEHKDEVLGRTREGVEVLGAAEFEFESDVALHFETLDAQHVGA